MPMALFDWKSVFVLALIVLIGWYLFTTESGSNYLNSIKSKIINLLSSLNLPIFGSGIPNVKTGNTTMYLFVQSSLFDGKSFYLNNSLFEGVGSCDLSISSTVNVSSQNISISIINGKVNLKHENDKMKLNIQGTSKGIKILGEGDNKIYPAGEKGFDISVECLSKDFIITNILERKIVLEGANGNLSGIKGSRLLTNDKLEINGFLGNMKFMGNTTNLNGTILNIFLNGNEANIILQ
jgi:hypothetical protein